MRIITFTPDDRRALAHDRYFHPDPRVQRKMEVLWLKSHGLSHDDIAAYADVSLRTVQRYLDDYLEGGLPRLRRCRLASAPKPLGRARGLLGGILPEAPAPLDQAGPSHDRRSRPASAGASARSVTSSRTGWDSAGARPARSPCRPRRRSRNTPGTRPASCKRSWSRDWKQARRGRRQVLLRGRRSLRVGAVPGLPVVRGAAVRAGGLGSQAVQRPGGLRRGDAPVDPGDQRRLHQRRVSLYAASVRGGGRRGIADHAGAGQRAVPEVRLVQNLASSLGIELLYLPSYSPNLNLIERLWRFVRKQSLDSIYYEDLRGSRLRSISAWTICPQYTRAKWNR